MHAPTINRDIVLADLTIEGPDLSGHTHDGSESEGESVLASFASPLDRGRAIPHSAVLSVA